MFSCRHDNDVVASDLHTIARQGQTRLTARLSGAFCSFRLGGRQPTCVSKNKNHSKIHSCQVQAVLPEQKCVQTRKGPQKILVVLSRDLTLYGPISARQNRVCPCQAMVTSEEEPKEAMGKIAFKKHTDTKTG